MVNYRPISLLITLSKLLEKCMYSRLFNFVTKYNIYYNVTMQMCYPFAGNLCTPVLGLSA